MSCRIHQQTPCSCFLAAFNQATAPYPTNAFRTAYPLSAIFDFPCSHRYGTSALRADIADRYNRYAMPASAKAVQMGLDVMQIEGCVRAGAGPSDRAKGLTNLYCTWY